LIWRESLKRSPILYGLNSWRRGREVERKYQKVAGRYRPDVPRRSFDELWRLKEMHQSFPLVPRVLYCGTDPLQDFGGFVQVLGKYCDLQLMRRPDGQYGQAVEGIAWAENAHALDWTLEQLRENDWTPDIIMMQSMGSRFRSDDLVHLKRKSGAKIVNIGMDERLAYVLGRHQGLELGISGLNSAVDLALVTVPEAVEWYALDGIPAKYFPLASSSEVYFPLLDEPKIYDVGFIGRAYGRRLDLAKSISSAGMTFQAHGPGWPGGVLQVEANNRFYNSCRVVLGTGNIGHSRRLMNPKLRDFEVPLTGVPYVTNYSWELERLYKPGSEIILYRDEADLVRLLRELIDRPDLAGRIGAGGLHRASSEHRFEHRFDVLFKSLLQGKSDAEFVRGGTS
jgi:spore maturation protein CgeB